MWNYVLIYRESCDAEVYDPMTARADTPEELIEHFDKVTAEAGAHGGKIEILFCAQVFKEFEIVPFEYAIRHELKAKNAWNSKSTPSNDPTVGNQ